MNDKDLRKLAVYIVDELIARQDNKNEEYIYMDEICKLTGLGANTVYRHRELNMPIERHGGKLCSKRSALLAWIQNR